MKTLTHIHTICNEERAEEEEEKKKEVVCF
jgi:hypothetical protein